MVVLYNKKILTVQCALLSDKKIKQATAEKNTKLCKTRLIGFCLDSKHFSPLECTYWNSSDGTATQALDCNYTILQLQLYFRTIRDRLYHKLPTFISLLHVMILVTFYMHCIPHRPRIFRIWQYRGNFSSLMLMSRPYCSPRKLIITARVGLFCDILIRVPAPAWPRLILKCKMYFF